MKGVTIERENNTVEYLSVVVDAWTDTVMVICDDVVGEIYIKMLFLGKLSLNYCNEVSKWGNLIMLLNNFL